MSDWRTEAERLKFTEGKSWTETAEAVARFFPDLDKQQVFEKVRGALRQTDSYKKRGNVTFEDKKEPTEQDVADYFSQLVSLNNATMKLETKQNRATIAIDDDRPIGLTFWGDWHMGAKGVDYQQLDADATLIAETDGLHVIGMGDYQDNALPTVHPDATYETLASTDMQDLLVQMMFRRTKDKHVATIRGCHENFSKRTANKDFVQSLCDITGAVNLWHGGIINLAVGDEEYRIGARHKFKFESSLNTTNSQRNFINEFGPCDIVAVAHKHYTEMQHTRRMGKETIYLRSGSYKRYDEFGQKLAGYEGIYGVPVVILYPGQHKMLPVQDLREAVELLGGLRR